MREAGEAKHGKCPVCEHVDELLEFCDAVYHGSELDFYQQQQRTLEESLEQLKKMIQELKPEDEENDNTVMVKSVANIVSTPRNETVEYKELFQAGVSGSSIVTMNILRAGFISIHSSINETKKLLNKMGNKATSFRMSINPQRNLLSAYTHFQGVNKPETEGFSYWRVDRCLTDIDVARLSNDTSCAVRVTFKEMGGALILSCSQPSEASHICGLINEYTGRGLCVLEKQLIWGSTCKKKGGFGRFASRYISLVGSEVTLYKSHNLEEMLDQVSIKNNLPDCDDDRSCIFKSGSDCLKIRFSSSAERDDFFKLSALSPQRHALLRVTTEPDFLPINDSPSLTRVKSLSVTSAYSSHFSRKSRVRLQDLKKIQEVTDRVSKCRQFLEELQDAESLKNMTPSVYQQFENTNKVSYLQFTDIAVEKMENVMNSEASDGLEFIFWMMATIERSISDHQGIKFTDNLYFPRNVWEQKNVKFIAYDLKIQTCNDILPLLQSTFDKFNCDEQFLVSKRQNFKPLLEMCVAGSQKFRNTLSRYLPHVHSVKTGASTNIFRFLGQQLDKKFTRATTIAANQRDFSPYVKKIQLIMSYGKVIERCYKVFQQSSDDESKEILQKLQELLRFIGVFCIVVVNDMKTLVDSYLKRSINYMNS